MIDLEKNVIGIALGDGKGQGFKAGKLSASVHAYLHTYANSRLSPSETLRKINNNMRQWCAPSNYVTLIYGILDLDSMDFHFSHAAHPYLLHYKNGTGEISGPEKDGGPWIPWFHDVEYPDEYIKLNPGDLVIAWTDGITEVLDQHDKAFGSKGVQLAVKKYIDESVDALAEQIYQSAAGFLGASLLQDDATVIVLRRRAT